MLVYGILPDATFAQYDHCERDELGETASLLKTGSCQLPHASARWLQAYVRAFERKMVRRCRLALYTFRAEILPTSFDRRSGDSFQYGGHIDNPTPHRPFRSRSCTFGLTDRHS